MTDLVQDYARECAAQGMRGDYSICRQDFTVPMVDLAHDAEDDAVWRLLSDRQSNLAKDLAHESYLHGLDALGLMDTVPDFERVGLRLRELTGWTIVPVPGLIPAEPFFDHLANRRFPVTNWLRTRDELDYIVEPDMFHDFFGHVPILTQPRFADFMQLYGELASDACERGGAGMITRLYWYTAEYGLIRDASGTLKAFGAGLMSSGTELRFALTEEAKIRPADIETIMRTTYEIDRFQRVYFALNSFADLHQALENCDLSALIERWKDAETLDPETL